MYVNWQGCDLHFSGEQYRIHPDQFDVNMDCVISIRPPHSDFTNHLDIKDNDTITKAEIVGDNIHVQMESGDRYVLCDFKNLRKMYMIKAPISPN